MSLLERIAWGLLAGAAIVLVKILGPDQPYVRSLFEGASAADVAFYAFISVITVLLGLVSGAFSNERDRVKLMLFCASVPGLLSTATAERREPLTPQIVRETSGAADSEAAMLPSFPFIVTLARAQPAGDEFVCNEASFLEQFSQSAKNYLTGTKSSDVPQFSVVVWSTTDLEEAKRIADQLAAAQGNWQPSVGCRRPGNDYYPVTIGTPSTQLEAAKLLGQFAEANLLSEQPFLSNYPYRTAIYTPPS